MLVYDLWLTACWHALLLRPHAVHIQGAGLEGVPLLTNLERWVAKVGEDVVGSGLGQVVCQVLKGSLASDDCLSAIAEHGQLHSISMSQQACSNDAHTILAACNLPNFEEF